MGSGLKPRIVVSGVNLVELGPLTVFREALRSLVGVHGDAYEIVGLVHRKVLFEIPGVTYLEFPGIKGSWIRRLRFEYFESLRISKRLRPRLWVAMHDMTPRVISEQQVTYCHNPAPFYGFDFKEAMLDPKFGFFMLFYRFLYRIYLHRNTAVIVQQDWIRKEFTRRYGAGNVIVAFPTIKPSPTSVSQLSKNSREIYRFFYPAFARTFKNHRLLLEAVLLLERRKVDGFEVMITINAASNRCAADLFRRYSNLQKVSWLGVISRQRVCELYGESDCLVFPSKLETWGLPLTEFKATGKPILVADLPYAHETIGSYDQVVFFDALDSVELADQMERAIRGTLKWKTAHGTTINEPFAGDWEALWKLLLHGVPSSAACKAETSSS